MAKLMVIPSDITPAIRAFCARINPAAEPLFVDFRKTEGSAREAFAHVREYVKKHGGKALAGWRIYAIPGMLLEAEFHCVHQDGAGVYSDITENQIEQGRVLFLPDPSKRAPAKPVANVRMALTEDPLLKEFMDVSDQIFEEADKQAYHGGEARLTPELRNLFQEKAYIIAQLKEKAGPAGP